MSGVAAQESHVLRGVFYSDITSVGITFQTVYAGRCLHYASNMQVCFVLAAVPSLGLYCDLSFDCGAVNCKSCY